MLSPAALTVVAVVGALTALGGAILGMFQYDIKRVLAYSTISQLGFMFIALGVGAVRRGAVPPRHARLLQGVPVPRLGLGDPRHAPSDARAHDRAPRRATMRESETDRHALGSGDDEHQPARLDPRVESDPTDPQDMRNMGGLGALMPRDEVDLPHRLLGDRRLPLGGGLLVQGRDPGGGVRAQLDAPVARSRHRARPA